MNWSLCGSSNPIIAGDGYAYVSYGSAHTDYSSFPGIALNSVQVLRVSSDGGWGLIPLTSMSNAVDEGQCEVTMIGMITNADQGVLVNWGTMVPSAPTAGTTYIWSGGMAITSGGGVSTVSTDELWGNMYPVLQAQDGSFVASFSDPNTGANNMVEFGQGGGIRWTVPNEAPLIATADGGVIGASGITYDQNGSATGMVETPIYSWKGNAYEVGSVDQVFMPPPDFALSLWNVFQQYSPTAGRPWYFKLVWENKCQDPLYQWPYCGWPLYPGDPTVNLKLAIDGSSQIAAIKSAALAALKKAFDKWPVTVNANGGVNVSEGTPGTGDNYAYVSDGYGANGYADSCGWTADSARTDSKVFYGENMSQAQWALQIVLKTAQDVTNALGRADLMKAIGTGIGNTSAHEIGHQFFGATGSGMHDGSTNTYNGVFCSGEAAPWGYGVGPINWEAVTANAWTQVLSGGGHPRQ
jgi:hypothetical protein